MAEERSEAAPAENQENNPEKDGADGKFELQENVVGNFKAKEHKEEEEEKPPHYKFIDLGNESNISDWLVGMLSGRLQDWFIGNLEFVGYYADKMLNKVDKAFDRRDEKKQLGLEESKKDKKKGKNKDKTTAKERNETKAKNARETADKAKKNLANRTYDNTAKGKNQKAFDQMTVESLQREADYRQKVAADPSYAKSKEGKAARAELIGDRRALAAMQKETGVNNKIVEGSFKKKTKAAKAAQRAKIGLKMAGAAAKTQTNKAIGDLKKAHQRNMKKLKQKTNESKPLLKLKSQMKNMFNQKTKTTQQQGRNVAAARKAQKQGR